MSTIWTSEGNYRKAGYKGEPDLERAVELVKDELFGKSRIYLPIKKLIGKKGAKRNIPDGYLVDLSGSYPRLFVVENELAAHDPLRHIAVQILEFSLAFESDGRGVKAVLFSAIQKDPEALKKCEDYIRERDIRNLDHFLEYLVFDAPFAALVIIDELPDTLETVLAKKFQFGVEVLELAKYRNREGDEVYAFKPFLADVVDDAPKIEPSDVDTVVVPAREEGVKEVFLREDRWYEVRIHGSMRPQIKYIAVYQVAPVSAITHVAPVKSIEPWKNGTKYVITFAHAAKSIGPIKLVKKGRVKALQNLRYTSLSRLEKAKNLDDVW